MTGSSESVSDSQYSLIKILLIWAAAAVPMAILAWGVKPLIAPDFETDPIGVAVYKLGLLAIGLIWVFVLSLIIIYREEGDLQWSTLKQRLRLNTPEDPNTGVPSHKLWLWVIPFILLLFMIWAFAPPTVDSWWVTAIPAFEAPADADIGKVLQDSEVSEKLVGAWYFVGLFGILAVFNILGEEFLFRGVLLPKSEGAFGKWDWVGNGVLFGCYHMHQPWAIPGSIIIGVFGFALPAKRYRSTWMSMIVHSVQFTILLPIVIIAILG